MVEVLPSSPVKLQLISAAKFQIVELITVV